MNTKATVINTADICELAHHYTVLECNDIGNNFPIDVENENGDITYSEQAQDIFIRHLNIIEEILGHNQN